MSLLPTNLSQSPGLYQRPKRKRAHPEQDFQKGVVELLPRMLAGNAMFFHIPNGGKRNAREAAKFKAMGVRAGVPDIVILADGRAYFMELKAGRGALTQSQREFHAALGRAGCPTAVVRDADDLIAALKEWGIALNGTWYVPGGKSDTDSPRPALDEIVQGERL